MNDASCAQLVALSLEGWQVHGPLLDEWGRYLVSAARDGYWRFGVHPDSPDEAVARLIEQIDR